jgi:endogenous inhibitor of DNA gyrase (YacG/DUF329 family)
MSSKSDSIPESSGDSNDQQGKSPWICPRCGHFVVRTTTNHAAHRCVGQSDDVDLIPYLSSEQAAAIRRTQPRL